MHRTIFTTPVVNTVLRAFSVAYLKLTGWKVQGSLPPECAKSVFIAAPLLTMLAGWLPALHAARQDPAAILREE